MAQQGHIIVQKGLKMHKKGQKIEFLDLKSLLFSGIFLSGIRGYPPPLNGQNPLSSFSHNLKHISLNKPVLASPALRHICDLPGIAKI